MLQYNIVEGTIMTVLLVQENQVEAGFVPFANFAGTLKCSWRTRRTVMGAKYLIACTRETLVRGI
jgi:hypothetical protein